MLSQIPSPKLSAVAPRLPAQHRHRRSESQVAERHHSRRLCPYDLFQSARAVRLTLVGPLISQLSFAGKHSSPARRLTSMAGCWISSRFEMRLYRQKFCQPFIQIGSGSFDVCSRLSTRFQHGCFHQQVRLHSDRQLEWRRKQADRACVGHRS